MTMMDLTPFKCNVCKKDSEHFILMSTNCMGHYDLDLRPPEMQRSTIYQLIQECPHCGNVSYNISDNEADINFLNSTEYKTCGGINFNSDYSKKFYKAYLIGKENDSLIDQFVYAKNCAWSCDDFEDVDNAIMMRKICIDLCNVLISKETDIDKKNHFKLLKLDFMRRAREFDNLIDEFEGVVFNDEVLDKVLQFGIKKAKEKDDACYTMEVIK